MTDEQRAMYAAAVLLRNNEVTLRWTRTQIFFLIHSAGLSLIVTQFKEESFARFLGCLLGLALAGLWWRLTIRIGGWVSYWVGRLAALENLGPPPAVRIFSGSPYRTAMRGFTAHEILLWLVRVFSAAWFLLAFSSLIALTAR